MCGFALIGKIETVAMIANIFIFITFIVVNLSVIRLRIKDKDSERPFRIPINIKGIPVISVLGILMTLLLLGYSIYSLFNLQ
jgi:basic amino acid/polyamine antiporter, APA family